MSDSELISRDRLLRFWDSLSRDEIEEVRAVAGGGAELTVALVRRLDPVFGATGGAWGTQDWTFWLRRHMSAFVDSLPISIEIEVPFDASDEGVDEWEAAKAEFGHSNFRRDLERSRSTSSMGQGRRTAVFVEGR